MSGEDGEEMRDGWEYGDRVIHDVGFGVPVVSKIVILRAEMDRLGGELEFGESE